MVKRSAALLRAKVTAWTPSVLQVAALALIAAGFWVLALPAGLIAAGVCVGIIGWAVEQ